MDTEEIRGKIKEVISNVTNIDSEEIGDTASFVEDLQLDSLSLLEIGVDVDYEFKLGVAEERLGELRTVKDAVELVQQCLAELHRIQTLAGCSSDPLCIGRSIVHHPCTVRLMLKALDPVLPGRARWAVAPPSTASTRGDLSRWARSSWGL